MDVPPSSKTSTAPNAAEVHHDANDARNIPSVPAPDTLGSDRITPAKRNAAGDFDDDIDRITPAKPPASSNSTEVKIATPDEDEDLRRKFGGPAFAKPKKQTWEASFPGATAQQIEENNVVDQKKRDLPPLCGIAWHKVLQHKNLAPYSDKPLDTSIGLLLQRACLGLYRKSNVIAQVNGLELEHGVFTTTLSDATGYIKCSILDDALEKYEELFGVGTVVELRGICAVLYPQRFASGYRVDLNDGLHVTIKESHIVSISPSTPKLKSKPKKLRLLYTEDAYRPVLDKHQLYRTYRRGQTYNTRRSDESIDEPETRTSRTKRTKRSAE